MNATRATTLLPPNATPFERSLEDAMREEIDFAKVGTLWDPATCPSEVLPYLAWGLSISHWDTAWSETEKREAVAGAIAFHKIKGTRAAVEYVLARFHQLLTVVESWEDGALDLPHRFQIRAPAPEIGPDFLTEETAAAIVRDVAAAKPLRAHFDFVQEFRAQGAVYLAAGGMAGTMFRSDFTTAIDTSRDWTKVLQTEDGEPILTEDGTDYLEDE